MVDNLSDAARDAFRLMRDENLTLFGPRSRGSAFQLMTPNGPRADLGSIVQADTVTEMLRCGLLIEDDPLPSGHTSVNVSYKIDSSKNPPSARTDAKGDVGPPRG